MSICTKTGDQGTTGLMYNRRVSKTHPRIEAFGAVDELNSAIGLARAHAASEFARAKLLTIQSELVSLMGELATAKEDMTRYLKDGFSVIAPEMAARLEEWIHDIEAQKVSFKGWATPGENVEAAALDMARAISRRAERRIQELLESGEIENRLLQVYLNRVSDFLWLLARWSESPRQK